MKHMAQLMITLLLSLAASLWAFAGQHDPLFINMTTQDSHRSDMAISFGAAQQKLGHPVTIFLNDQGVAVASTAYANRFTKQQKC